MEDYLQLLLQILEWIPDVVFSSPAFPTAFGAAIAALTMIHSDIIFASLDFIRLTVTQDCLHTGSRPPTPSSRSHAEAIRNVVNIQGLELTGYLLAGLVGDFPQDSASAVVTIFRRLSALWPTQLLSWLPPVLEKLPATAPFDVAKKQFMVDMTR